MVKEWRCPECNKPRKFNKGDKMRICHGCQVEMKVREKKPSGRVIKKVVRVRRR